MKCGMGWLRNGGGGRERGERGSQVQSHYHTSLGLHPEVPGTREKCSIGFGRCIEC